VRVRIRTLHMLACVGDECWPTQDRAWHIRTVRQDNVMEDNVKWKSGVRNIRMMKKKLRRAQRRAGQGRSDMMSLNEIDSVPMIG
jgi:hypothetical protein